MRLSDIRNMIEKSTNRDWHHIPCWGHGAGPSYRDQWGKWTGSGDTWGLDHDSHAHVLVYRENVQLSISWGLGQDNDEPKASPDWLEHFPMVETVDYFPADIFWNGSLIDRHHLVVFDGGRNYLPAPWPVYQRDGGKPVLKGYEVTPWHVGLARLLHQVEHVDDFDEVLRRARFEVVDHLTK